MKICEKHWAMCRSAIESRGLSHLVRSGAENMARAIEELEGIDMPQPGYDPLAALNYMIWGRGLEVMGLNAMIVDESKKDDPEQNNGHICTLCIALASYDHHNTDTGRCGDPDCKIQMKPGELPWDQNMIDGASDAILEYCRKENLITTQ